MDGPTEVRSAYDGSFVKVDVEGWPGLGSWEIVRVHDATAVLPLTPDDEVVMVRQFRAPVRQQLTEIPAGLLDVDGEDALTAAGRELFEETGFRHSAIEFLGGFYPSPGTTDQYVHLFWARVGAAPEGEPEPGIDVVTFSFDRMVAAARSGKVRDGKTALALLMAAGRPPLP
jgi:ADP-ribose pyrophosphatase